MIMANKEEHVLMIVESPNKRETLKEFLPSNYTVMASFGHICKINDSGKFNLGIDVDGDFAADFKIDPGKRDIVKQLREAVKLADKVVIASDSDYEGEAIAYHLKNFLKIPDTKYERVTFHEITKKTVLEALANPRKIDYNKAISAITRACEDKIIGFRVSITVMSKVGAKSAGRVQSAWLKVLAMREEDIANFVPQTYYEVWLPITYKSKDYRVQYKGTTSKKMVSIPDKPHADQVIADCKGGKYILSSIESKDRSIPSKLPFTTSTLQQEVSSKLGYAQKKITECIQKLYEGISVGGKHVALITYIRTDSTYMNEEFAETLAQYVKQQYGTKYYAPVKRGKKEKNVQDAHECIRPVDLEMTPDKLQQYVDDTQLIKIYKIIYERTVAAAMADCIMEDSEYSILNGEHRFAYTRHAVKFDGFRKVYDYKEDSDEDSLYPDIPLNTVVKAKTPEVVAKETTPPSRYSEAALIKKMDELGIGRPSTIANTITILEDPERGYVEKEGKLLKVTEKGMRLSKFLDDWFGDIINLTYTAEMEANLDKIANGLLDSVESMREFYSKLSIDLEKAKNADSVKPVAKIAEGKVCPNCGKPLVHRQGKFGEFLACTGYPKCKYTEKIVDPNVVQATTTTTQKEAPKVTGYKCPDCGADIVIRKNAQGQPFYACGGFPKHKRIFNDLEFKKIVGKQSVNKIANG